MTSSTQYSTITFHFVDLTWIIYNNFISYSIPIVGVGYAMFSFILFNPTLLMHIGYCHLVVWIMTPYFSSIMRAIKFDGVVGFPHWREYSMSIGSIIHIEESSLLKLDISTFVLDMLGKTLFTYYLYCVAWIGVFCRNGKAKNNSRFCERKNMLCKLLNICI